LVFSWALKHYDINTARTMAFCSIVFFEWLVALNARSDEHSVFKIGVFKNMWLWKAMLTGVALQLTVVYVPFFQQFFETTSLGIHQWAVLILPGLFIFLFETLRKMIVPKLFSSGKWQP
jgi:Ca2+-transporting ATPase